VKSGSVGRGGGTSTWSSPPVADAVAPTCQSPTLLPKAAAANPSPPETACSDPGQLESILEAPPDSPRAFVTISSPYKRKSKEPKTSDATLYNIVMTSSGHFLRLVTVRANLSNRDTVGPYK